MRLSIAVTCVFLIMQASYAGDTLKSMSKKKWYSPHYIPIQYAGNIGFLSTGIGYSARKDNYQFSLVYGYAPESIAGVQVHMLTAKNIFPIHRFYLDEQRTLVPYASVGVSLEVGGRSFFFLPSNMVKGYYDFPKSIHLIPAAGLKLRQMTERISFFQGVEFFAEATTVDAYVWYKVISDEVSIDQIFTLAVGINLLRK